MAPSILVEQQSVVETAQLDPNGPMFCADIASAVLSSPSLLSKDTLFALADKIAEIDPESCEPGDEDSFFIADLAKISASLKLWKEQLPMVQPFYAVKCNPNVEVLKLLAKQGCNFDCALKTEIETVLNLGVDPLRIIYANPCKTASYIRSAKNLKVNLTTVDNGNELHKLSRFYPEVGILIRIATDDESAQCRLLTKFGCTISTALNELLPLAKELNLNVRGVAFHVGLGATEFLLIFKAISDLKVVFERAKLLGFENLDVLDIGGGFQQSSFKEASQVVRKLLDQFFFNEISCGEVTVIAEPGRFMVADAFALATHVIGRRESVDLDIPPMLYINDGVYGNMNCILFDHQTPRARVLTSRGRCVAFTENAINSHVFLIWGPTCDGLDCITDGVKLGHDVQVGDWLYFADLGAYTAAATTSFNGFSSEARVFYVNLE